MARWIRLVKAHPTMASSWSTSIVLKYRTGETSAPVDLRAIPVDLRARKPGGYPPLSRVRWVKGVAQQVRRWPEGLLGQKI